MNPPGTGLSLTVWVQPRAPRTELAGWHDGALKIRLAAPPVDGAANDELVRFLAGRLGVPRAAVTITAGRTGRRKDIAVAGLTRAAIVDRLGIDKPPAPD